MEKLNGVDKLYRLNLEELNLKNGEYISAEKIKVKELNELHGKIGELKSNEILSKLESENRVLELLKNSVQKWNNIYFIL